MDKKLYGRVRALFATVLVTSVATLGIAAAVGSNAAVWVRGTIVTAIAAVLLILAGRAFRGSRAAYLRMRLMSGAAPIAVAITVAVPHDGFPAWMKAEQVFIGILLLAATALVGRKAVRQTYSKAGQQDE